MGIRVWLDDIRPMPEGYDLWCKTAQDCLHEVEKGRVDYISFDHDLGHLEEDGSWLADEIEFLAYKDKIQSIAWDVHSSNPVGRKVIDYCMKNMNSILNRYRMK